MNILNFELIFKNFALLHNNARKYEGTYSYFDVSKLNKR